MAVLLITNAGPDIGGGHLSRCLALAQALEAHNLECRWLLNREASSQAEALGVGNAAFVRNPFDEEAVGGLPAFDFAVVDSYLCPASFCARLRERGNVVAIDDLRDRGVERFASVVINYAIGARREFYASGACRYLLGPAYALLRREFWSLKPREGGYVLFAPGAADVLGCSRRMIEWWRPEWPRLLAVLGALVPEEGRRAAARAASARPNVDVTTAPPDFARLLADAGMVVCSASVTAYEALAMRKRLAVFSVAPNQEGLGGELRRLGAAYDMGGWETVSAGVIEEALAFSPGRGVLEKLVRADGAARCAAELLSILGEG